jgi:type I restriction enzyme M protein
MKDSRKLFKQYFTPDVVARFMVMNTPLQPGSRVIDPAVGDGVFIRSLESLPFGSFTGIDVDEDRVLELQNIFQGDKRIRLIVADALKEAPGTGTMDAAVGNPPFSNQKQKVRSREILKGYSLAGKRKALPMEILFLERFVRLLKPGGQLRIILPINVFVNRDLQFARDYILRELRVEAIVELPPDTFPGTPAKAAILFAVKEKEAPPCQVSLVSIESAGELKSLAHLCIKDPALGIQRGTEEIRHRMDPRYHWGKARLDSLLAECPWPLAPVGDLAGIRGGFTRYGPRKSQIYSSSTGEDSIRLIKAKNISPLGFREDRGSFFIRQGEGVFHKKAQAQPSSVLFVRVGAGCIGRAYCIPGPRFPGQADDWFFILDGCRVNPFYLAFCLNSPLGRAQVTLEMHGTGTVSINREKLSGIRIPLLPGPDQESFEKSLRAVYRLYGEGDRAGAERLFREEESRLMHLLSLESLDTIPAKVREKPPGTPGKVETGR